MGENITEETFIYSGFVVRSTVFLQYDYQNAF